MSFVLLYLEKFPTLLGKTIDVWFKLQEMKGAERLAAEAHLISFARSCFRAKPTVNDIRTKWEVVKDELEIKAFLDGFFDGLK